MRFMQQLPKLSDLPSNKWMSNEDIDQVLALYAQTFHGFRYFNTTTCDFAVCDMRTRNKSASYREDLSARLKHITAFEQMVDVMEGCRDLIGLDAAAMRKFVREGITDVAVVLNTDYCVGRGKHWVCVYINLQERQVEFFNSGGSLDTRQWWGKCISLFTAYLQRQLAEACPAPTPVTLTIADKFLQRQNYTCGPSCVFYILCRVLRLTHEQIQHSMCSPANQ